MYVFSSFVIYFGPSCFSYGFMNVCSYVFVSYVCVSFFLYLCMRDALSFFYYFYEFRDFFISLGMCCFFSSLVFMYFVRSFFLISLCRYIYVLMSSCSYVLRSFVMFVRYLYMSFFIEVAVMSFVGFFLYVLLALRRNFFRAFVLSVVYGLYFVSYVSLSLFSSYVVYLFSYFVV